MKVAIIGGAKTGKTYYSKTLSSDIIHTDDSMFLKWSDNSLFISHLFDLDESEFVVEGIVVVRV